MAPTLIGCAHSPNDDNNDNGDNGDNDGDVFWQKIKNNDINFLLGCALAQ